MSKTTLVLYSGGMGSFLAASVLKFHEKKDNIVLYFNDTKSEDSDLYRFLYETAEWLDLPLVVDMDGRDIWQVFNDVRFMGNSQFDPCSRILKRERAKQYIKANYNVENVEIAIGIDMWEDHRYTRAKENWSPYELIAPLITHYIDTKSLSEKLLNLSGIKLPRLYKLGFAHNNCFSGDTRFLTEDGFVSFKETVGQKVKVLNSEKQFVPAEVKSFGKQKLFKLKLKQYNKEQEFFTTIDHNWYVWKGQRCDRTVIKPTSELKAGDRLPVVKPDDESKASSSYTVVSVEATDREEEVYCAVVPGTHDFVLENYILTKNCGGFCVKAGLAHFKNLLEKDRTFYIKCELAELALYEKIGRHPFLKKTIKGETFYMTLREYREFLESGEKLECFEEFDVGACSCFL